MKKIAILLVAISFYGCGTNTRVIEKYSPSDGDIYSYEIHKKAPIPKKAMNVFMRSFTKHLSDNSMASNEEGESKKKIDITVDHYFMRSGGSRFMSGAFAGCDKIQTTVEIIDPSANNKVLGSSKFESSNCTGWGTAKGLIDGHVQSIVKFANPDATFSN